MARYLCVRNRIYKLQQTYHTASWPVGVAVKDNAIGAAGLDFESGTGQIAQSRQRLATSATFSCSCVAQALNCGDGSRQLSPVASIIKMCFFSCRINKSCLLLFSISYSYAIINVFLSFNFTCFLGSTSQTGSHQQPPVKKPSNQPPPPPK